MVCIRSCHPRQRTDGACLDEARTLYVDSLSDNTGSIECWKLVNTWIADCVNNHPNCNDDSDDKWFPTRLLDLGCEPDSPALRIVLSEREKPAGKYATLSYRWKSSEALLLLLNDLETFRDLIPAHKLPEVIRSAVDVTRKLGIRYLWWILCVLSKTTLDWQQESAEMGMIYRKAWINLSASGASDVGKEGLFFARDPEAVRPVQIRLASTHGDVERYYLMRHTFWEDQFRQSAIFERGWVFQERLLSRRVLHFGKDQILWECRETCCCETFPHGLHPALRERSQFATNLSYSSWRQGELGISLSYHRDNVINSGGAPDENLVQYWNMRIWQAITASYSQCQLTRSHDKLIALSGIAKDMSRVLKDDYLAGNWKSHLPEVLMWTGRVTRPRPLRAPTWSWASVDGKIQ